MKDNLGADLIVLRDAAEEAAALAMRYWRQSPVTKRKADGSPVTEADLAVDALLSDRLRLMRPDYGWLSEESADDERRLSASRVFIVDPIDGTRAFLQGRDDWAIALSIVEDGAPVAALVVNPVRKEIFEARAGGGAFLNGQRIVASNTEKLEGARIIAGDGVLKKAIWDKPWPELGEASATSIIYRLALVADGRLDAAFALKPKCDWDVSAGALLVSEAGGFATSPFGEPLRFNTPVAKVQGFLAAAPNLHQILIDRLENAAYSMGLTLTRETMP